VRGMFRLRKSWVAAALVLGSPLAHATGLGPITVLSALGQPLRGEIDLIEMPGTDAAGGVSVRLASYEMFQRAGVEYDQSLRALQFRVVDRGAGHRVIEVRSASPVSEPYLDMLVEMDSDSGPLIRRYTFLLDPLDYAGDASNRPSGARLAAAPGKTPAPAPELPESARPPLIAPVPRPELAAAAPAQVAGLQSTEEPVLSAPRAAAPAAPKAAAAPAAPAVRWAAAPRVRVAAPAVAESELASAGSEPARTYTVHSGDTLSGIALKFKLDGVSLNSMQQAIFQSNPAAFIRGDMNLLRADVVLAIPGPVNPSAAAVPATPVGPAAKASSSGPSAAPDASSAAATALAVQPDRAHAPQPPAKAPAAPGAAAERDLSVQIEQLRETLHHMDDEIARLQAIAAAGPAAAPAAAAPASAGAPAASPAAMAPAPIAATARAPASVAASAPAPAPVSGLNEDTGGQVLGPVSIGAALLALIAGLVGYRLRRRGAAPAPMRARASAPAPEAPDAIAHDQPEFSDDEARIEPSESELTDIGTHEVDPMTEADVYLAYGRSSQAKEILAEALRKRPDQLKLRCKLLEIHAANKDLAAFNAEAQVLFDLSQGLGPEWDRAQELGRQLDPSNPLYCSDPGETDKAAQAGKPSGVNVQPSPAEARIQESALELELQGLNDMKTIPVPRTGAARPEPGVVAVTNKLSLARAFSEIGNLSEAREVLDEVIGKGDAKQRKRAETARKDLGA
jgi:pilus assembly protein FimV